MWQLSLSTFTHLHSICRLVVLIRPDQIKDNQLIYDKNRAANKPAARFFYIFTSFHHPKPGRAYLRQLPLW